MATTTKGTVATKSICPLLSTNLDLRVSLCIRPSLSTLPIYTPQYCIQYYQLRITCFSPRQVWPILVRVHDCICISMIHLMGSIVYMYKQYSLLKRKVRRYTEENISCAIKTLQLNIKHLDTSLFKSPEPLSEFCVLLFGNVFHI